MGPFVINLENLSELRLKTPEIRENLDLRLFLLNSIALSQRRFYGRGRHRGSGANAAKFTVNVWEKS